MDDHTFSTGDFTERDQHIITEVRKVAHERVALRTGQITAAVTDFEKAADDHIHTYLDRLSGDASFTFGTVVDSLIGVLGTVLVPEVAVGEAVLDAAREVFVTGLKEAVLAGENTGSGAEERLRSAVAHLSYEISTREGVANARLEHEVDDIVLNAFDQFGEPQADPAWYDQVCDQMGFVYPSRENIYDPVRQWLEYEFIGLLTTVRAELMLSHGFDSDVIHPRQWGVEAQHDERQSYDHQQGLDRESAWQDSYLPKTDNGV